MKRVLLTATGVAIVLSFAALPARGYETKVFPNTDGLRIHDVAPAPDGLVWWTARGAGMLGILDPQTGESRFVELGPDSAPHGVIQGPDGLAWITDSGQNAIVSYDPSNQDVTVYPLPEDTGYTNLNTPAIDGDGNVWFTGQNGIYGKLTVATGNVQVWESPKGRGPYGITTTPDGDIWWVSRAGSYLAEVVNRETGEIRVIEPPEPGVGLRRVWSGSKGNLWTSEWNGGHLGRYVPATGEWTRWRVPGAPEGENAGIYAIYVDDQDIVWVSNFTDNAVYSFDPATEQFTKVPGSDPESDVRQILGSPGVIWLPESGNNSIMRIDTTTPGA